MSPSRVVLRWVCVSTIMGITVLPARLTRVPPAGTRTSAVGPTCAILVPSTTSVAFSITRPSPTINRAPSYAVTDCADAGIANPPRKPRVTIAATAATFIRCMETSSIKYGLERFQFTRVRDLYPARRRASVRCINLDAEHRHPTNVEISGRGQRLQFRFRQSQHHLSKPHRTGLL